MSPVIALRKKDDSSHGLDVAVIERTDMPGVWAVEALDYDNEGVAYIALFAGPHSEERAREYADLKYETTETG